MPIILDVGNPESSHFPDLYLPSPSLRDRSSSQGLTLHGTIRLAEDCKILDSGNNLIIDKGQYSPESSLPLPSVIPQTSMHFNDLYIDGSIYDKYGNAIIENGRKQ